MNVDVSTITDTSYIDQYMTCFQLIREKQKSSLLADLNITNEIFSFLQVRKSCNQEWIQYELLHGRTSGLIRGVPWSLREMYRPDSVMAFASLCAGGHLDELEKHEDIIKRWQFLGEMCLTSACAFDRLDIVEYLITHCATSLDCTSLVHLIYSNSHRAFDWLCRNNHISERHHQSISGFLCAYDRPQMDFIWSEYMKSQNRENQQMFVYGLDGMWRWVNFW